MRHLRLYLISGISLTVFLFVVGEFLHKPTFKKVSHSNLYSQSSRCPDDQACFPKARYLSPRELLSRPLLPINASVPKFIHQSWSSRELPAKFQRWSDTWRSNHPDWEWVLWTDEDNKALVERYFPWFREAYGQLGGEILRADAVRNMYMYTFGGYNCHLKSLIAVSTLISTLSVSVLSTDYSSEKLRCRFLILHRGRMSRTFLASTRKRFLDGWDMTNNSHTPFQMLGWRPRHIIRSLCCLWR